MRKMYLKKVNYFNNPYKNLHSVNSFLIRYSGNPWERENIAHIFNAVLRSL